MYSFFNKKPELYEGLQEQELRDLVHNEIHIDEFQAKMADDDQIVVVSFKVRYRPAAADLESFLEKGYKHVLDAEASKAEYEDSWYLVFVEFERRLDFPERLLDIIKDMKNITNTKDWKFKYGASRKRNSPEWPLTVQNLKKVVPLSPKKYRDLRDQNKKEADDLESLLMASAVKITGKKEISEDDYNLKVAAGLPVSKFKVNRVRSKR